MYIIVVGGGRVGYYLTKELLEAGHELVILEKDSRRARQIADELGSIVLARDGCEGKHLAEAGANRAAIVAAVTGDDEDNLVVCQMAKHHFEVPRTIARVNNPKNEPLFKHLGFVTNRTFETFYADTIPVLMLPRDFVESIYGPAALALVPGEDVGAFLSDAMQRPEHYWDAVLKTREHLTRHHSYAHRLQQLAELAGSRTGGRR